MNKHIELVKKWLEDKESVSLEELKANKEGANTAYAAADAAAHVANAADVAAHVANAACVAVYYAANKAANKADYAANAADVAAYWVNKYEELTK